MNTEMNIGKRISNLIVTVVFLIVILAIFFIVVLRVTTYHIVGHSMNPTLIEDELVLAIPKKEYNRGDIISFEAEGGTAIKRVIGIPGDKVFIDTDGTVYVNSEKLEEEYINNKEQGQIEVNNPYTVGPNEYFVLGDNRGDSKDSRLLKIGGVNKSKINSKIVFSISKFKILK